MGYKIEFNWVLKLKPEYGLPKKLEKGKIYNFKKPEERIYPLNMSIGLCSYKSDEILAKIIVTEFKVSPNKTEGKFKILKVCEVQND